MLSLSNRLPCSVLEGLDGPGPTLPPPHEREKIDYLRKSFSISHLQSTSRGLPTTEEDRALKAVVAGRSPVAGWTARPLRRVGPSNQNRRRTLD
jgi:hypothetical protein